MAGGNYGNVTKKQAFLLLRREVDFPECFHSTISRTDLKCSYAVVELNQLGMMDLPCSAALLFPLFIFPLGFWIKLGCGPHYWEGLSSISKSNNKCLN